MDEWLRAWHTWLNGQEVSQLWGISPIWWAGAGKILQLWAGLTIVLDLIGPEPFDRAGKRITHIGARTLRMVHSIAEVALASLPIPMMFIGFLAAHVGYQVLAWSLLDMLFPGEPDDATPPIFRNPVVLLGAMAAWVVCSFLGCVIDRLAKLELLAAERREGLFQKGFRVAIQAPGVTLGGLLVIVILALPSALWAASVASLSMLTWTLKRSKIAHLLKWTALFLFLLGFHFDLLYT
jgi:hypothetical protein